MGILHIHPDTQQLGEVIVKGNLPVTRMKGDAMVTNVENSVLSKVGSANDVLGKIPGITKTQDSYEVFGKGTPLIYINGRKLNDLTELEQLNADEIKNVEVIRNPGSRYDASVKAVIRIQTVKRKGEGFGFNLRSSYYQSKNTDWIEQANLNYRHHNLDIFGSVYFSDMRYLQDYTVVLRKKGTQEWVHDMNSGGSNLSKMLKGDIGLNYQIDDKHTLGIKYQPNKQLSEVGYRETYTHVTTDDRLYDDIHSIADYFSDYDWGHEVNAYYNGTVGSVNIDFNLDYFQNGNRDHSTVKELSENYEDRDVHSVGDVKNRLAAGKLVVSFPIGKGTFSVGSEVTYTHRNDDYLNEENYVPDSYSKLEETNMAAFAEYNRSFSWGDWSLGMRYEHDKFDYFENDRHMDDQSRTFDNVFPNLSFSTKIGGIQTQLSYTAKTVRPSYQQLSNNVFYSDRFTLQKGSPALRPTLIHDLSLSAVWKWIQLSLSYSQTKDWILYWGNLITEDGSQTMLSYRNWDKSIPAFSALLSLTPTVGCWSPMMGLGMKKQWLTVASFGESFKLEKPVFIASFNNIIKLPEGFMIGLDASIQSKGAYQNVYFEHPTGSVDISVRKSFLKDALSVELRGNDLLDTNREFIHLYSGDYNIYQKNRYDRREFSVTVRYKFNATKSNYKGTGAGQSQKNRI
ncbi:outer membrane beta-barrel family protein [Bacteroides mediterraneensis]|uniref:outer membrane beta-barrel family protein n=1 Tax=Bacteroides mediterraneensis TaxID=1841856 RepID=UPI0026EED558|nr:outer membrane beta-barrel family protein [Bacteroides mediterraneensis]